MLMHYLIECAGGVVPDERQRLLSGERIPGAVQRLGGASGCRIWQLRRRAASPRRQAPVSASPNPCARDGLAPPASAEYGRLKDEPPLLGGAELPFLCVLPLEPCSVGVKCLRVLSLGVFGDMLFMRTPHEDTLQLAE